MSASGSSHQPVFSDDEYLREEELSGLGNIRRLLLYKGAAQSPHTGTAEETSWVDGIKNLASSFLYLEVDPHDREKELKRLSSAMNTETGSFNDVLDVLAGASEGFSFHDDRTKRDRYTAQVSSLLPDYHKIAESFGVPSRITSCDEQCGEAFSQPLLISPEGSDEKTRITADRVKYKWMNLSEYIAEDMYWEHERLKNHQISQNACSKESATVINDRLRLVQSERGESSSSEYDDSKNDVQPFCRMY